jgi:hypothetical protein
MISVSARADFGSQDAVTVYPRSIGRTAAVVEEDGRYAVYRICGTKVSGRIVQGTSR